MILTQCACCAAPLPHLAKQCSRCKTRYCGPACQAQHWKEGGHDKVCKKIKRGGGAEQYHADKQYKEAVKVAVEKCADDTKGQTCYICTEAVHWKTKEGLVRGCSCRGTSGFAHVSCLTEQAKILVAEGEENNLDDEEFNERFDRWHTCSLCEQQYHGVVRCALGWACWKTYVGRPEDQTQCMAMNLLGTGLQNVERHADTLSVREAELSMERRLGSTEDTILIVKSNLATSYGNVGQLEKALRMRRDVYSGRLKLSGEEHFNTLVAASNYAESLVVRERYAEAKALWLKTISVARRVFGDRAVLTLKLNSSYARGLNGDPNATVDDLCEAVTTLEETMPTARRVLGGAHPVTADIEKRLRTSRVALRARETPPRSA